MYASDSASEFQNTDISYTAFQKKPIGFRNKISNSVHEHSLWYMWSVWDNERDLKARDQLGKRLPEDVEATVFLKDLQKTLQTHFTHFPDKVLKNKYRAFLLDPPLYQPTLRCILEYQIKVQATLCIPSEDDDLPMENCTLKWNLVAYAGLARIIQQTVKSSEVWIVHGGQWSHDSSGSCVTLDLNLNSSPLPIHIVRVRSSGAPDELLLEKIRPYDENYFTFEYVSTSNKNSQQFNLMRTITVNEFFCTKKNFTDAKTFMFPVQDNRDVVHARAALSGMLKNAVRGKILPSVYSRRSENYSALGSPLSLKGISENKSKAQKNYPAEMTSPVFFSNRKSQDRSGKENFYSTGVLKKKRNGIMTVSKLLGLLGWIIILCMAGGILYLFGNISHIEGLWEGLSFKNQTCSDQLEIINPPLEEQSSVCQWDSFVPGIFLPQTADSKPNRSLEDTNFFPGLYYEWSAVWNKFILWFQALWSKSKQIHSCIVNS